MVAVETAMADPRLGSGGDGTVELQSISVGLDEWQPRRRRCPGSEGAQGQARAVASGKKGGRQCRGSWAGAEMGCVVGSREVEGGAKRQKKEADQEIEEEPLDLSH